MKIWNIDALTGLLMSEGAADPDPMEAGNWLIPAHATTIAPPLPEQDHDAFFLDGAWQLIPIKAASQPPELTPEEIKAAASLVIKRQIAELEAQMTPRRLREAIRSADHSFLDELEAQIEALRVQLA